MTDRDQKILDAAIAVFSRYGVRKATMGDIAEQAGISRPTLYARLRQQGRDHGGGNAADLRTVINEVVEAWQSVETISERIDIFLDCAIVRFFDQIKQMPDSSDLMIGSGEGAAPHLDAEQGKIDLLTGLFDSRREALAAHGMQPGGTGGFLLCERLKLQVHRT
jgi:AcrR family transcriptional regulator